MKTVHGDCLIQPLLDQTSKSEAGRVGRGFIFTQLPARGQEVASVWHICQHFTAPGYHKRIVLSCIAGIAQVERCGVIKDTRCLTRESLLPTVGSISVSNWGAIHLLTWDPSFLFILFFLFIPSSCFFSLHIFEHLCMRGSTKLLAKYLVLNFLPQKDIIVARKTDYLSFK